MKSKRSSRFRALLYGLPIEVQRQAFTAYRLFKRDPFHKSLMFKLVDPSKALWSVRVGLYYRALGVRKDDDTIIWVWIGTHSDYDKLLSR